MRNAIRLAAVCGILAAAAALAVRRAKDSDALPADETAADVRRAAQRFLTFGLIPVWVVPGFLDYRIHRAAKIEQTSGTHESITHLLMISTTGAGVAAGLFFEIDATALALMAASAVAHEAVLVWDLSYAANARPPSAAEQHVHSFLEVIPFTAFAFSACLHPRAFRAALTGREIGLRLTPRYHPDAPLYIAAILTLVTLGLFVPYTEELIRCWRTDRTILPHQRDERHDMP